MGRLIGSVVAGYVVILILVFVGFAVAARVLGVERVLQPGTYDPSSIWVVISFVLSFAAAVIGGLVCAAVARTARGPRVLAGVILVLGILFALPGIFRSSDAPATRAGSVSAMDALRQGRQPTWIALLNPIVGALGVVVGAGLFAQRRRLGDAPPPDRAA